MNDFRYNPMAQRITPMVKNLLIANVAVFVVLLILARQSPYHVWWPAAVLGLSRSGLLHGMLWQPFSYMFVHGSLMHILANMFGLYFLGPEVERTIGSRRFIIFYLLSGMAAGLVWVLFSGGDSPCIGASGAVYAVVAAFAGLYPRRRLTMLLYFVIPINMSATTLILVLVGGSLLMALSDRGGNIAHTAHLAGAVIGYLYGNYLRSGRIGFGSRNSWTPAEIKARIRRGRMRVIEPQDKPVDWGRVDAILDKVRFYGIGSLTAAEKELLDRASRHRNL